MAERKLEVRTYSFELEGMERLRRSDGGDGREVVGIAVPYGVDQLIYPGLVERFELGSFAHQLRAIHRVPYMWNHYAQGGHPVGRLHKGEETPKGLRVFMRVSNTDRGNELLELVGDEVLRELSIGFYENKNRQDGQVTVRAKADLSEVAQVLRGAYGKGAAVSGIRSEDERPNAHRVAQMLAMLPPADMLG